MHYLTLLFLISVVEAKDGTISVASAFADHQEGNLNFLFWISLLCFLWECNKFFSNHILCFLYEVDMDPCEILFIGQVTIVSLFIYILLMDWRPRSHRQEKTIPHFAAIGCVSKDCFTWNVASSTSNRYQSIRRLFYMEWGLPLLIVSIRRNAMSIYHRNRER